MTGSDHAKSREPRPIRIKATADLVDCFAQDKPDYGIYPPRPQFTAGFTSDDYRRHALAGNQLPLPVPLVFSFRVPASVGDTGLEHYLDRMFCELALQGLLFDSDRVVEELDIGAGSATRLQPSQVESLLKNIQQHFTIQSAAHRECSIFAGAIADQPGTISSLVGLGINRLRLGLVGSQTKLEPALAALSFESAATLTETARRAGVRSVGADLHYGLAGQTVHEFEQIVARMLVLRPDRIDCKDGHRKPIGPGAAMRGDDPRRPGPAARFEMALLALNRLSAAGYRHLGNGHYARSGDDLAVAKDKAMLHYTTRGYSSHGYNDCIGFGAAAISHVYHCYAENLPAVEAYISRLEKRHLAVTRGLELSRDDRVRSSVIQTILCQDKLVYKDVERQFGIDFQSYFRAEITKLDRLQRDGLMDVRDDEITLTPAGDLMRSRIAREFDPFAV